MAFSLQSIHLLRQSGRYCPPPLPLEKNPNQAQSRQPHSHSLPLHESSLPSPYSHASAAGFFLLHCRLFGLVVAHFQSTVTPILRNSVFAKSISPSNSLCASGQSWNVITPQPRRTRRYAPRETRAQNGSCCARARARLVFDFCAREKERGREGRRAAPRRGRW